ncbi:MAG TPA: CsbD family protein [Bryobacterales bacterium]|nr:CsbD family protein [Bryobacterales bacterium]
MTWEQIGGNWSQFKGRVRERWDRLTEDDLAMVNGQREQLVGRIQEKYGITKEVVEQQLQQFLASFQEMSQPGKAQGPQRGKPEEQRRTGSLG